MEWARGRVGILVKEGMEKSRKEWEGAGNQGWKGTTTYHPTYLGSVPCREAGERERDHQNVLLLEPLAHDLGINRW